MSFLQEFKLEYGDRFKNLRFKNVAVSRANKTATVTFLYPSSDKEISEKDKREIQNWLEEKLQLGELSLKTKFMRVFVEEKLIKKAIIAFLDEKFKLVSTYLSADNFKVEITPIDVKITVTLSTRLANYFVEHNVSAELSKHLKSSFLVEFSIFTNVDAEIVDEVDIENVEMKATYKITPRYEVEVIKEGFGKDFVRFPEFISNIKGQRKDVTVAGFIRRIERIDYVRKTGTRAGEQAVRFVFTLQDTKGKIEAIYFSSKSNVAVMDALEEGMFVEVGGDVKPNYMGKLNLVVKKLALATIINDDVIIPGLKKDKEEKNVVKIEKIDTLMQDNMFDAGVRYNSKIAGKSIVVFDIETTGLSTENDQITEIGAVKLVDGVFTEKFYSFVKPDISIPPEVVEKTGINDEMVKDAPKVDGVIRDFYDFTRGCTICGHNVINFDMRFIYREGARLGLNFDNDLIDTMREAQNAKLRTSRYNLASVLKVLGLHNEGAHRAWNDAYATAQALLKMNEI